MTQRVLVTGISGYVAQHVAAELLGRGYEVVGTVRSLAKSESPRSAIAAVAPVETLTFVEADLLSDDGWDAALRGCDYLMHVASPFFLAEPKDENEFIAPAVGGTKRVLNAAKRAGVKRVVLTSSVVAMTAGKPSGRYGSDSWSDLDANIGAYAKSKTLAERTAWEIVADGSMELVAINPGFVLGPSLGTAGDGQSVALISGLIAGKMPMIPDIAMGMVDVRDVARLHVAAMTATGAPGKRFIAATDEPVAMEHVASVLRNAGYKNVPSRRVPSFAIKVMSVFDREAKGMVPQLGKKVAYDTQDTYDVLEWQPTPLETTLVEMAAAITQ
ncbi:MAG: NAD-dependent epimerase/dehydratase family protein [Acidimicrobiia bacterium]